MNAVQKFLGNGSSKPVKGVHAALEAAEGMNEEELHKIMKVLDEPADPR